MAAYAFATEKLATHKGSHLLLAGDTSIQLARNMGSSGLSSPSLLAASSKILGSSLPQAAYNHKQRRSSTVVRASLHLKGRSGLDASAFHGKSVSLWQVNTCLGRKGASPKRLAVQANGLATDGVHMDPKGLIVLEEETIVTQEEWEEAKQTVRQKKSTERWIERAIFNCRFFTLLGVAGSLFGSLLCFLKGTYYVGKAMQGYITLLMVRHDKGQVVMKLIEALDTYLVGTVMLIFGMGLYELFVMKLDGPEEAEHHSSNLFGLFRLQERPMWLAINGLDDLKTKLGHVIVMILLVGMFEKSKKVHPACSLDLFWTATSVLMCAASLYLLNRLKH